MRKRENKKEAKKVELVRIEEEVAEGGLAVHEADGSLFHITPPDVAKSLRFLLARLPQYAEVGTRQTLAITSALEGEGVTTVARSLAAIMAHDLERRVCLLETNWWLPESNNGSEPGLRPGLAEVVKGSSTIEDALFHTNDARLVVMTSGQLPIAARPAMVASTAFSDVLQVLAKGFETVVMDVPAVLMASEATTIARHADATGLVVRQGVTTERQVKMAIEELSGTELLGVIVNRSSTRVPRFLQRVLPE